MALFNGPAPPGNQGQARARPGHVSPFVLWNVAAGFIVILAMQAAVALIWKVRSTIVLVLIAIFFAVVLGPGVDLARRRLRLPRGLAIAVVFLAGLLVAAIVSSLFLTPLYAAARSFAADAPELVRRAATDPGPVGEAVRRYDVEEWVSGNAPRLSEVLRNAGGPALQTARHVLGGFATLVLLGVLTFMILLEGPKAVNRAVARLEPRRAAQVRRIGREVAQALTGYVLGSLFTSAIAGTIMAGTLYLLGVPYAFVFGVWVAMVTLLPQIGGLIAAVPTAAFAALHAPRAGVVVLVVFVVYQWVENHLISPMVMSRTVKLNALWVLLAVLVGAQLGSIVGALFAIPTAGGVQVLLREIVRERRQRRADEPEEPVRDSGTAPVDPIAVGSLL